MPIPTPPSQPNPPMPPGTVVDGTYVEYWPDGTYLDYKLQG